MSMRSLPRGRGDGFTFEHGALLPFHLQRHGHSCAAWGARQRGMDDWGADAYLVYST